VIPELAAVASLAATDSAVLAAILLPEIPVAEAAVTQVFAVLTSVEASVLYFVANDAAVEIAALAEVTCAEVAPERLAVPNAALAEVSALLYAEASAEAVAAAAL
jgi:hypothetical protein